MANILTDVVYITAQDVIDSTSIPWLQTLATSEIEKLIVKAQYAIDDYIVCYGEKFDSTQSFLFPIKDEDGNSFLPSDITVATLYVVEFMYSNPDVTNNTLSSRVKKEKVLTHDVEYNDEKKGSALYIPDSAKSILDRYKSMFYRQVL